MKAVRFFRESEEYGELSNFWKLTEPLLYNGCLCKTSEHAYQLSKFVYAGCPIANAEYVQVIAEARTPFSAKILANQKCTGNSPWQKRLLVKIDEYRIKGVEIDPDWDARRDDVMYDVLRHKFLIDQKARKVLLSTGDAEIVENSKYDSYWGVGDGSGQNKLGKLLMRVRDEIRTSNLLFGVSGIILDDARVWGK